MDNKKVIYIILFFNFLLVTESCNNKQEKTLNDNKDPFYIESSDFDLIRFPLLKPYEAISINNGQDWMVQSTSEIKKDLNSITSIKQISNFRDVFIIHSNGKIIINGKEVKEAWYILVPKDSMVKGFENKSSYLKYIRSMKIKEVNWKTPKELFKQFDDTYCLPWIPDCKS